jgi:transposase-like protein
MNIHQNARLTPQGRLLLVERIAEQGWGVGRAAQAAGLSTRQAYRWCSRYRSGGIAALHEPQPLFEAGRRGAGRGNRAAAAAAALDRTRHRTPAAHAASTMGKVRRRLGFGRLSALEPKPPAVRYERARPGELIHIDVKKLGRIAAVGHRISGDRRDKHTGAGWEYVHVCIDDTSPLAYSEMLPDERKQSAVPFLEPALA